MWYTQIIRIFEPVEFHDSRGLSMPSCQNEANWAIKYSERISEELQTWGREPGNIVRECFVNGAFVFWNMQIKLVSLQPEMVHSPNYLEQNAEKGQGSAMKEVWGRVSPHR